VSVDFRSSLGPEVAQRHAEKGNTRSCWNMENKRLTRSRTYGGLLLSEYGTEHERPGSTETGPRTLSVMVCGRGKRVYFIARHTRAVQKSHNRQCPSLKTEPYSTALAQAASSTTSSVISLSIPSSSSPNLGDRSNFSEKGVCR
jgi:hypothetical protein